MNKKQIIMLAGAGIICFAASFVFAWLRMPKPVVQTEPNEPSQAALPVVTDLANIKSDTYINTDANNAAFRKAMTEKQLKLLIQSMRAKMAEVDQKEQDLAIREQQIGIAKDTLKKDVNDLNKLQIELAAATAAVRQEREKLESLRVQITQDEISNFKKTASIYDRMDSASGSKILSKMCANEQTDDAVKILNYMTERTAAKMLGEIGTTDPNLAANLCEKLKKVKEEK
jgi:hypothetical protein